MIDPRSSSWRRRTTKGTLSPVLANLGTVLAEHPILFLCISDTPTCLQLVCIVAQSTRYSPHQYNNDGPSRIAITLAIFLISIPTIRTTSESRADSWLSLLDQTTQYPTWVEIFGSIFNDASLLWEVWAYRNYLPRNLRLSDGPSRMTMLRFGRNTVRKILAEFDHGIAS